MKLRFPILICALLAAPATAQQPVAANPGPAADPFVRQPGEAVQRRNDGPKSVSVCFEVFSLELADAAALYRQHLSDDKMYRQILDRVTRKTATLEHFSVLRARSGEKAVVEGISELIYPTEHEAPSTPNSLTLPGPATNGNDQAPADPDPAHKRGVIAEAMPKSFETRNTGFSLEIEPTIGMNDTIIDLRLAPDFTRFVEREKWGSGKSEVELPLFESQRITTAATVVSGKPHLLGTPSRTPHSKLDADSANRVWFAFVTVDVISVTE